jgi:hypothetical protein
MPNTIGSIDAARLTSLPEMPGAVARIRGHANIHENQGDADRDHRAQHHGDEVVGRLLSALGRRRPEGGNERLVRGHHDNGDEPDWDPRGNEECIGLRTRAEGERDAHIEDQPGEDARPCGDSGQARLPEDGTVCVPA